MSEREVADQLNYFEKKVLKALHQLKSAAPEEIQRESGLKQFVEVMNASSWLQAKGLVQIDESMGKFYSLKRRQKASKPLPERTAIEVLWKTHHGKGTMEELKESKKFKDEEVSIALGWMRRKGWAELTKDGKETIIALTERGKEALHKKGDDELLIEALAKGEVADKDAKKEIIESLKSRKDILNERTVVTRTISLTPLGEKVAALDFHIKEEVAQLTPELVQSGRWREIEVRKYDVKAFAPTVYGGRRHPMTILLDRARSVFLHMGFTEITGGYVDSAFWAMDALFTPQDHPARELQDTFYVRDSEGLDLSGDEDLVERIRQIHENGWKTGSLGWRYKWSRAEAERALLRPHTTLNTVKYIAGNPDPPFKVFCIGRVFRNEAMDSTHLPEFTQIEGIVCEKGASMDMLCGVLKEFYARMGLPKVRIRPGYFPYTEPSLEVEVYFNDQWMEMGGAGVFRPEVTLPLGVEEPVLAWGLGFERLAMLLLDLDDIRDIYVSDIDWLKKIPQL